MSNLFLPKKQGLYDPRFERDNCGVGFIAHLKGKKSHAVIRDGIQILENLTHRGACGCDPKTGDGAGILIQIPDAFFRKVCAKIHIELPPLGEYGAGIVFLPPSLEDRNTMEEWFEHIIHEEGQKFLGFREVPHNSDEIGHVARSVEPDFKQVFIGKGEETDLEDFERKLYVIRKRLYNTVQASVLPQKSYYYFCSLSSKTIVYKGQLMPEQLDKFFLDLSDENMASAIAMVHSRYSTNTFPTWALAHPYRMIVHNGEINTLRGNINWMYAREMQFISEKFGKDIDKVLPIVVPHGSDSATFDNVFEMLVLSGRSLPQAIMMMIPEAWSGHESMPEDKKAFYEYNSCLMEPWDGPASIAFTDGRCIGAVLDRNGLRPSRYLITKDDYVIMGSETGVLPIEPERVLTKGRLQPGKIFLIDTQEGRIVDDASLKQEYIDRRPFTQWIKDNVVDIKDLPTPRQVHGLREKTLLERQRAFGYTIEDLKMLLQPMAVNAVEATGSMGIDTPLAVLSYQPKLLFYYFKQLFAQVTNPPVDPIREEVIMAEDIMLGSEGNLLDETPEQCHRLRVSRPIITNEELEKIRHVNIPSPISNKSPRPLLQKGEKKDMGSPPLQRGADAYAVPSIGITDKRGARGDLKSITLSTLFPSSEGVEGLETELERLFAEADKAIEKGYSILILSDRGVNKKNVPMPSLLACSGLHHHLIRGGTRTKVSLVIETGEAREMHHFAVLIGYGANAINPYLAFETIEYEIQQGRYEGPSADKSPRPPLSKEEEQINREKKDMGGSPLFQSGGRGDLNESNSNPKMTFQVAQKNYIKSTRKGLFKIISKMGISTIQSYCGAQIFEAVGLGQEFIDKYFSATPSRIGGIGADVVAEEMLRRHRRAYPDYNVYDHMLDQGGDYHWRQDGEHHQLNPKVIGILQHAVRVGDFKIYKQFAKLCNDQETNFAAIRGLLKFKKGSPIPIQEVEPASEIVKRFATGAMSYGSISKEAHETLAIAMNRLGGFSNTGEGGEDPDRFVPDVNGDLRRSKIKQVAQGRFGVTIEYLVNADQLQIKMAQGAKPGEGGQLPGHKVSQEIANTRHTTKGVGLISPPPHHDIYSIEDLAQLIHDLKNSNPKADVSVKLVAEIGVGTIAAGVSKGKSDHLLISGYGGGTGASPQTSIQHAGLPMELGIAETQQVLVMNDLRGRIRVQTDSQLKTGRDVVIAGMLGADEFGFSTIALVTMGCILLRKCHLNTCSVGIATQDKDLRKKFAGKPEYVVNYFNFIAEEVREIMAELGYRKFEDLIGHVDRLETREAIDHWKAKGIDLTNILHKPDVPEGVAIHHVEGQDHGLDKALDTRLIENCQEAIENKKPIHFDSKIKNTNRTVGTMLSSEIARRYGLAGLPEDTIQIKFTGSAGQSFAAFLAHGVTFTLAGDANDYVGKGLSGGKLVIRPSEKSTFVPEENILIGNVVLYGAICGEAYFRGLAGERFCVRNSGALTVVEGIGDHGCEYMTGGRVVVLGSVGRNFAAGMSGGIAYIWDKQSNFKGKCNMGMVELFPVEEENDIKELKLLITKHFNYTKSAVARKILDQWESAIGQFVKVYPSDYRRVLEETRIKRGSTTRIEHGSLK